MSTYAVVYSDEALEVLNSMPEAAMKRVVEHLVRFADNPHKPGASKVRLDGKRVVAVPGVATAVCEIHEAEKLVVTVQVLRPV